MTLFESLSLAIAAGQMLVGVTGVVLVWIGVRQMIRANDARAERDGVLLESLRRANESLDRTNESLGHTNESLGHTNESLSRTNEALSRATESLRYSNEALAELLRDRRQAGKGDAP